MLGREIEFFYWLRRGVHCRLTSASGQELERYDVPEVGWIDAMCDGAEEMAFSNAISQYNIDIVHFQHLGHHALSLPIIAKACGTGVVFSAHDFWLVSSRYNLLNHELRYNEGEVMSVVAQDVVLKAAENIEYGCEETRRAFVSKMLHSVDAILFGTRHSHDLTHTVYPILDQKQSLTLGIPSPENTVPVTRKSFEPLGDRPLAIAIVGNFLRTKGADTILSLIDIAHPDYFEFHIFGYVHPEYDAVLKAYNRRNVKTYGRYTAGDIEALKIADVALNLSIWPETYCISLSEAWQNGLIPIVTDVGALGDRVVDGVNGFKVPIGRPSAVLERLELLRSSDAMRRRMMENITSDLWTNAQRYGEELKRVYESVAPVRELGIAELAIDSGQVHLIPHASWRHQAPPRHIFDPPTIRDLSIELPEVPEDWIDIQGGECYVDDVCNFILAEGTDDEFPGAQSFHLRGWYFVPGVRGSGTMYVTLIGAPDRPVIFIECTRELRGDIVSLFPDAPRRSGFNCEVALRGKWCEGSYRVGLVNVVNGQGTFQLTTIEIDVTGGAVVALRRSPPSNQTIMTGFSRVIHEDGILREVKLARIAQSGLRREDRASVEWYLDRLGQEPVTTGACEPETDIPVGGWAFMPGATGSGQLYIACVSDVNEEVFLFAMHRLARADVRKVHLGAPLMSGFSGNLRLGSGYARTMDGSYRVCIVNVVGEVIGVVLTNFGITTRSGVMVSIEHVDVSVEMSERVSALLGKKAFA